jgi:chromosome segregation ATPase
MPYPAALGDAWMTAVPFDTLKLADRLEAGGFSAEQARTFAGALADAVSGSEIATKQDLANLATKAELQAIKVEVQAVAADVQTLKVDVQALKVDVQTLKVDVQTLKVDVQTLKVDVQTLKVDVQTLKVDVQALKVDVQTVKSDVQALRGDFQTSKVDIQGIRSELRSGLAETKTDILKWMVGTIGLQTAAILGAVIAIMRLMH